MAAHPDRMKVSPARPRNSASKRRSRWSGLVQSAKARWPPTDAIRAALPMSRVLRAGSTSLTEETMSGPLGVCRGVGRAGAGEGERVDDRVAAGLRIGAAARVTIYLSAE